MKRILVILLLQFLTTNLVVANNEAGPKEPDSSKQQKLEKILLINFANSFTSGLSDAIQNKYPCGTNPAQLSQTIQFATLTATTPVNEFTIRRSNRIGMQIREFTNQHRAANGLGPLAWDPILARVGRQHTINMANGVKPFSHDGFDGRFQRYRNQVAGVRSFGENLFYGTGFTAQNVARAAVNAWIRSPGHNANLLGNFNRIGVSAFRNSQNVWYITQLFSLVVQ